MNRKILPGEITISRPINSRVDEEYISITIRDGISRCEVVEIRTSLENFTKALTGQGFIKCEIEYPPQDNIGKKREHKTEFVPFSGSYGEGKEESKTRALKSFEVDGWRAYRNDLGNPHKVSNQQGVQGFIVSFFRHVELEEDNND